MLKVGVAGGRRVRWTTPCPGFELDGAKGEASIVGSSGGPTIGALGQRGSCVHGRLNGMSKMKS